MDYKLAGFLHCFLHGKGRPLLPPSFSINTLVGGYRPGSGDQTRCLGRSDVLKEFLCALA